MTTGSLRPEIATSEVLQFKVHVVNGVLVPDDAADLPRGNAYLATLKPLPSSEKVDALAEIAALAQSLGPANLSREFDRYTKRVLNDDLAE